MVSAIDVTQDVLIVCAICFLLGNIRIFFPGIKKRLRQPLMRSERSSSASRSSSSRSAADLKGLIRSSICFDGTNFKSD